MEEPLGEGELPIWPDNLPAVEVFSRMLTQWTYAGLGVPVGLRYEVLPLMLRTQGVPRTQWQDVTDDIQVMERVALVILGKRR